MIPRSIFIVVFLIIPLFGDAPAQTSGISAGSGSHGTIGSRYLGTSSQPSHLHSGYPNPTINDPNVFLNDGEFSKAEKTLRKLSPLADHGHSPESWFEPDTYRIRRPPGLNLIQPWPTEFSSQKHPDVCPSCVTVDPAAAIGALKKLDISVEITPTVFAAPMTSTFDEFTEFDEPDNPILACSRVVQQLRDPDRKGKNSIDSFDEVCLDSEHHQSPTHRRQAMTKCYDLYVRFDQACLQAQQKTKEDERLMALTGILIVKADDGYRRFFCTAFRLNPTIIVTARHCLDAGQKLVGNMELLGKLFFISVNEALSFVGTSPPAAGNPIVGEITAKSELAGLEIPKFQPRVGDDIVFLRLDNVIPTKELRNDKNSFGIARPVHKGTPLTLIGLHEFVRRAVTLRAVLDDKNPPNDELLLATGEWTKLIRVHRSPACVAIPDGSGGIDHYCQSFNATSGSPIFVAPTWDGTNGTALPQLVGVHSRGNEEIERSYPSNQATAIDNERFLWLVHNAGL